MTLIFNSFGLQSYFPTLRTAMSYIPDLYKWPMSLASKYKLNMVDKVLTDKGARTPICAIGIKNSHATNDVV